MAVVSDGVLDVFDLEDTTAVRRTRVDLPFTCRALQIGCSERWLLAVEAKFRRGWIVDLVGGSAPLDIEGTDARPVIGGTLARLAGEEVALVVRERGRFESIRLDTHTPSFEISFPGFRLESLISIGGAERVVAVGRWDGDYRIVLGVVDVTRQDDRVVEQLHRTPGIIDESERLCVGPCGTDAFVVFREPDDIEEDELDDEDCRAPFWGLRGAYVRRLDGTVVQQIALDVVWEGRAPAAGGPRTLAVAGTDVVHLVDRATEQTESVAGRWLAATPDGARVLIERNSQLAILDL